MIPEYLRICYIIYIYVRCSIVQKIQAFDEQLLIRASDGRPCTMCLSLLSNKTKEQKSMVFSPFSPNHYLQITIRSIFVLYELLAIEKFSQFQLCYVFYNFVRGAFLPPEESVERGTRNAISSSNRLSRCAVTQRYVRNERATVSRKSWKVAGQM